MWLDEHTSLVSRYSIVLFHFVCIELVSLIWFLQIWVAIYVYGIMINWSTLIMKLMQTYIAKISGSILNLFTVHLNGIWHLIWRYLSAIPEGVRLIQVSRYLYQSDNNIRGTQREHSAKPLKHSIVKRILVFKR